MSVRVRFAPSPTGFLHVGGLRTALYNFLFARHHNGTFVLRIEDTDRSRFVENATENLINSLHWAGIDFDEGPVKEGKFGPYIQSERLSIYKKYANILIENGSAYYAFDTTEEIESMRNRQQDAKLDPKYSRSEGRNQFSLNDNETKRLVQEGIPYVIRLKVPDTQIIKFRDIIRGEVTVNSSDIDDQVLMKSDGFPTYHLANVVDDHLMEITHVIRGEEWLPSTPKHVLLYQAFGWSMPEFAHLPLLLNEDKSKLSKRQGSVAVEDFIAEGYFKEAFINFVALLGWNPTGDREIYSIEELIESFNLEKVNKGGAVFDRKKLGWFNFQYLRSKPASELAALLGKELEKINAPVFSIEYLEKVVELFRERINFIHEIIVNADYMFAPPKEFDQNYRDKHWKDNTLELLIPLIELFRQAEDFSHSELHDLTMKYVEEKGIKLKEVIHPIRLMLTGKSAGAGMFETMEVLGKEECLIRMEKFVRN